MSTYKTLSNASLVERALDDDAWAHEALYRKHVSVLLRLAARLLGNTHEAEDVVQEAFLEAFDTLSSLREPDRVRAWLIKITVHRVHRRFRRRRLARLFRRESACANVRALQVSSDLCPEQRAELHRLDDVLRSLPDAQRICWMLRCVEGHSLQEVAEASGCSLATAKRRIAKAQDVVAQHVATDVRGSIGDDESRSP